MGQPSAVLPDHPCGCHAGAVRAPDGLGWRERLGQGRAIMSTRSVQLETVTYRIDDIEHASRVFVKTLARYWVVLNTDQWIAYLMTLVQRIRQQQPRTAALRLEG